MYLKKDCILLKKNNYNVVSHELLFKNWTSFSKDNEI